MTTPANQSQGSDPLARFNAEPDVAALISEFSLAQEWGPSQQDKYSLAQATRFNRWEGQTTDGLKWQKYQERGTIVRPYDGRPDTRQPLSDSIINSLVDIDCTALWGARVKPSPSHATKMTAQQSAEMRSMVRWMMEGPLRSDLMQYSEYLSQTKWSLGWCVLFLYWKQRYGLRRETLTMDQLQAMAAQSAPGSLLSQLPEAILGSAATRPDDGTPNTPAGNESDEIIAAADLLKELYPYLKLGTAKKLVYQLKRNGECEFLYQELQENRPALKSLVPGLDVFLPEEVQDARDSRAWFVREYFSESDILAMEVNEGWDAAFVKEAVTKGGLVSFADQDITQRMRDKNNRRIEIVTAYVRQTDNDGVQAIYFTQFSAFVPSLYAKHGLFDDGNGEYPFEIDRAEIIGPAPDDSRGVPAVLRTQQWELKRHRDSLSVLAELRTNPPRLRLGLGWTKVQEQFAPGSDVTNTNPGSTLAYLSPPTDQGALASELCEAIKGESEDYYGLPRSKTESHPVRWQARQMRSTSRSLLAWGKAMLRLLTMCYENYSPQELQDIIGRQPLLNAKMLAQFQLNLDFDARSMDPEFLQMLLQQVALVRQWNTGGTIDDAKLVSFALSALDPTLGEEITRDQQGAANAIYKDTEHSVMSIMQGNPPQLSEGDPTSGMRLQFVKQLVGQNPEYQAALLPQINGQPNPRFDQLKAKNMETYAKNLQHGVQETQTSKIQGRLGVQAVNNIPVNSGPQTNGQ